MKMGSKRDDEKAVEELVSEAMDMVILEQAAAINNLPRHLETRFQLLKTFHSSTTQKPASFPIHNLPHTSRVRVGVKNEEQQTVKKLQQYEKWLSQECPKNISYSKSSGFRRFSRGRFWSCWRRESIEERDRNMRKMVEKARKEEDKICGEAEKVIKWVNYASAYIPN